MKSTKKKAMYALAPLRGCWPCVGVWECEGEWGEEKKGRRGDAEATGLEGGVEGGAGQEVGARRWDEEQGLSRQGWRGAPPLGAALLQGVPRMGTRVQGCPDPYAWLQG